jgi:hypothetical protein
MAADLRPEQRMSDDEVLAQITTFVSLLVLIRLPIEGEELCSLDTDIHQWAELTGQMLAGNETSSTALTWTLYLLTQHPETNELLRKECLEVPDDRPTLYVPHFILPRPTADETAKSCMLCPTSTASCTKLFASSRLCPAPCARPTKTLSSPWARPSEAKMAR